MNKSMNMWAIYEKPKDYPNDYVARRWEITEKAVPTGEILLADNIHTLRRKLPPGLHRIPRSLDDDPYILETWI